MDTYELSSSEVDEIKEFSRNQLMKLSMETSTPDDVLVLSNITLSTVQRLHFKYKDYFCRNLVDFRGDVFDLSDCLVEAIAVVRHEAHVAKEQIASCIVYTSFYIAKYGIVYFCN